MADLARVAGVSKNTISLALRNDRQIPPATRQRISRIARSMGYSKNATVAHLMAEMRRSRRASFQASLAVLNANLDARAFERHATLPTYLKGIRTRAAELGYALDEFWLHDPELDGQSLVRILRARGIRGILVVGLMRENLLPPGFETIWNEYPSVVTGVRTRLPALSFACTDHHGLALRAVEKAVELGYRRPALVLDRRIDQLVEGRFSAGFRTAQQALPDRRKTRPLFFSLEDAGNPGRFRAWHASEKPDVILTLYNVVGDWARAAGLRVPEDVGLIQLEWRDDSPEWAGMNQHNDVVGAAAVDMLIGMIHNNEAGVPAFPRATLIGSSWVDGGTVRPTQRPASIFAS